MFTEKNKSFKLFSIQQLIINYYYKYKDLYVILKNKASSFNLPFLKS